MKCVNSAGVYKHWLQLRAMLSILAPGSGEGPKLCYTSQLGEGPKLCYTSQLGEGPKLCYTSQLGFDWRGEEICQLITPLLCQVITEINLLYLISVDKDSQSQLLSAPFLSIIITIALLL